MKNKKIVGNFKQNKVIPKFKNNKKISIDTSINTSEYKNYSIKCKLGRYKKGKFKGKKEFTNFLKSEKDADLLTKREEEINQYFLENKKPPKFHIIAGENREKLIKILHEYNITKIDRDFYTTGINQGERFIVSDEIIEGNNVVSVIFVDFHHLVYPDQKHNMLDVSSYKYCISMRDKTGF